MKKVFLFSVLFSSGLTMAAQRVTLMTYNVQNLFDTYHDKGKLDYTYLPKSIKDSSPEVQEYCRNESNEHYRKECFELDWSPQVLNAKIKNLAKVIRESHAGVGPDILVLGEVENIKVLNWLNKQVLADLGYRHEVLIEGPDHRGIDVAVLSKYPVASSKGHVVSEKTRLVLEVNIKVGSKVLTVFANHWPSQNSGTEERIKAAKVLLKAADSAAEKGNFVIATGDFNTLPAESPNPIDDHLTKKASGDRYFIDALKEKNQAGAPVIHEGTHWYRGEWHHLDRVFVYAKSVIENNFVPNWRSLDVYKPSYLLKDLRWTNYETGQVSVHQVPMRFDPVTKQGFADHLALKFEVTTKN